MSEKDAICVFTVDGEEWATDDGYKAYTNNLDGSKIAKEMVVFTVNDGARKVALLLDKVLGFSHPKPKGDDR